MLLPIPGSVTANPAVQAALTHDFAPWDNDSRSLYADLRACMLISNFHNTRTPSFRPGCIGAITPANMRAAVTAMGHALDQPGVEPRKAD